MENKKQLECLIELLFIEIGEYQTNPDADKIKNVYRMKERYNILQQEYRERFNKFYEPKSI